jgi:2-oxoglutarate ferredoxin oxidoreductase subunit alpha
LEEQVKGYMVVELNQGQMLQDVKLRVNNRAPVGFYSRQGGMMPSPEEIVEAFKKQFE